MKIMKVIIIAIILNLTSFLSLFAEIDNLESITQNYNGSDMSKENPESTNEKVSTAEPIKIAVLGFHYEDLDARYVTAKLPKDIDMLAQKSDKFTLINEKEMKKQIKKYKIKLEQGVDQDKALTIAKNVGADIIIWGQVSTIGELNYNIAVFMLVAKSNEIEYYNEQIEKKAESRQEKLMELIEKGIELVSAVGKKEMDIAMGYFNAKQYDKAKEQFQKLLTINPNSYNAYYYIAYIAAIEQDYDVAIENYNKALEIKPDYASALEGIAWVYDITGEYEKAIEKYRQLASLIKDDPKFWLSIGKIYEKVDDLEEAIKAYQNCIDIQNDNKEANKSIAKIYVKREEYQEAIPYCQKVLELDMDDEEMNKKLAICYQKTGKIGDAIIQYKSLIKEFPKRKTNYLNLATAYLTIEEPDSALDVLQEYIKLDEKNPKGYYRIADIYRQKKNYSKAIEFANKAIEIAPDIADSYMILGEVAYEQGYANYESYLDYDKKARDASGAEYEKLDKLRVSSREKSHNLFIESENYYKTALEKTDKMSIKSSINEKLKIINQLKKETEKSFFDK